METISELVVRAASGSSRAERIQAFGQLVMRFQRMACGYAYSVLGDFHLAEDAAQNAFVVAFEQLGSLRQPEAFPRWFRQILSSACGRLTRRKALPTAPLGEAAAVRSAAPDPGASVAQTELRDKVLVA